MRQLCPETTRDRSFEAFCQWFECSSVSITPCSSIAMNLSFGIELTTSLQAESSDSRDNLLLLNDTHRPRGEAGFQFRKTSEQVSELWPRARFAQRPRWSLAGMNMLEVLKIIGFDLVHSLYGCAGIPSELENPGALRTSPSVVCDALHFGWLHQNRVPHAGQFGHLDESKAAPLLMF